MFTINQVPMLTPTTGPAVATGRGPLSVTVGPSGRFAYVANDDNTISMYTLKSVTGVLTPIVPLLESLWIHLESSPMSQIPTANNTVSEYLVDSSTRVLTPTAAVAVSTGNSPTSVAVDASAKFAYGVGRQDNTVSAYSIDADTGDLSAIATIPSGKNLGARRLIRPGSSPTSETRTTVPSRSTT
jgi:6-phosphogluconolactonase